MKNKTKRDETNETTRGERINLFTSLLEGLSSRRDLGLRLFSADVIFVVGLCSRSADYMWGDVRLLLGRFVLERCCFCWKEEPLRRQPTLLVLESPDLRHPTLDKTFFLIQWHFSRLLSILSSNVLYTSVSHFFKVLTHTHSLFSLLFLITHSLLCNSLYTCSLVSQCTPRELSLFLSFSLFFSDCSAFPLMNKTFIVYTVCGGY